MKKLAACVFAVSAMACLPAAANPYAGAAAGYSAQDFDCPADWSCDDSAGAFRIHAGWQLHDNFAAEIGYTTTGEYEYKNTVDDITYTGEYKGFDLSVLGVYPVNESFSVHARAGMAIFELDVTPTGEELSDDGADFLYGVGASYRLDDNWAVNADWTRVASDYDLDFLFAGVRYHF